MPADNATSHERKLVTILAADVAGYSRLMAEDEVATMQTLTEYREVFSERVIDHKGRIVDTAGDSVLAIFDSVVEAVQAAVDVQRDLGTRNETLPGHRKMHFRIGVNLGDIIVRDDGTIYGDGVNVAARLEGLAEPGGIMVSGSAHEQVEGKLDVGLSDAGEHEVKNIAKPVRVYQVHTGGSSKLPLTATSKRVRWVATAVVILAVAGVGVWQYAPNLVPGFGNAETVLALPDNPSIAVLPFANLSDDPEQEYFADGLTEDLITDLSKIQDLFVIARNSSFTYKGKPTKVQEVAADLGVRYVLEGSVRRTGDSVRINAQLIDATSGHHLWAERYEGAIEGIFEFHDQVLDQIVANLAVELVGADMEDGSGPAGTDVIAAYDALLTGREFARRRTPEDFNQAIIWFEKAIELDPNYGSAYAALAGAYWNIASLDWHFSVGTAWHHAYERMLTYLAKAKELPTGYAYAVSSEILARHGQYDEALADAERGLALEPNNPDIHISKARALNVMGRAEEAELSVHRALRLDPHHQPDYLRVLGHALFHQKRYDEAVEVLERVIGLQPNVGEDFVTLASAYGHLSRPAEADTMIEVADRIWVEYVGYPVTVQELGMFWWYGDIYDYDQSYLTRLQDGLRKAGVQEGAGEPQRLAEYRALMSKDNGTYAVEGAPKITVNEAKALHDRGVVVIDVRDHLEYRRGHIPGAVHLELATMLSEEALAEHVGKDDEVIFHCFGQYCPYSAYACAKAVTWGYTRVYHFESGYPAWEDAGYPTEQSLGM
jgi:TolB-like protein/class 3 adenylate cyclase/rhodanese-related sulfurtransferase/tetratricopeptide (TPR) repeat protein